ncbi:diguanylate cyclase domain-containing protein [Rhodoferax sp.]|uniref:diguanylate cyclase domain-containing protein n=1 Tax=Rhodoferax sp. TaxID=50421 RepID=UPI002844F5B2|nr:diguanylate cyclase [Rhodoferax sp.]MDR3369646.1 diguanylate cyclase [Rhodoferax sp.]
MQSLENSALQPWAAWALDYLEVGLLVLDGQNRVVFANQWFLRHARLSSTQVLHKSLPEVFPQLETSHFTLFLEHALASGFPALLSQTLHPAPFPLYMPASQRSQDKQLRQSIRIIPMGYQAASAAEQRYTLIQISDVTNSVLRERLLKAQASKLQDMANLDSLTGLGNRRLLDDKLLVELRAASRLGTSVAAIMFDLDYFKQFNDLYGHLSGDECLRKVATILRDICKRPHDLVARFGGEEMVAILPETDRAGALQLAGEVLRRVRKLGIAHAGSAVADVLTLSAGVAVSEPGHLLTPEALLDQADHALYSAKNAGRNQVCGTRTQGESLALTH